MKVLTVPDNTASFAVLPSNGSSEVTVVPAASSSAGGVMNGFAGNVILGEESLSADTTDNLIGGPGTFTFVGTALHFSFSGTFNVTPDGETDASITLSLLIDDEPAVIPYGAAFTVPAAAGASQVPVAFSGWIGAGAITPGEHSLHVQYISGNGTYSWGQNANGELGVPAIASGYQWEDWTLPE